MRRSYRRVYTIIDIFSRKAVGWTIAERESEKIARRLITATCAEKASTGTP